VSGKIEAIAYLEYLYEATLSRLAETVNPPGGLKSLERRTSNAQHRTLNIDDATLYRLFYKRIEEIRNVDSLPVFVATSADKAYSAFF
jgi:hypothetical protein